MLLSLLPPSCLVVLIRDLANIQFRYITIIRGANINPGIPQCKNCWKWGHAIFLCRIQGSKCINFNRPHKSENHCEFGWCCKANKKTNPPCLEIKQDKLYLHTFKCSNCWGDHQVDSNLCLFWKHRFNHKWHQKKYVEIHENRTKSIHSIRNSNL